MRKRFIYLFVCLLIILSCCINVYGASRTYTKDCLTGGSSNCLDSIDGDSLADGYRAMVITDDQPYFYYLDAFSGASADGFNIIAPANNPGNKRWILKENIHSIKKYNNNLVTAIASIGSTPTTLKISDAVTIPDGTTINIPKTLILEFDSGGTISGIALGGTETLTFALGAYIDAGRHQIFGSDLTVTGLKDSFPEWWPNGIPDGILDNTEAVQAAINATINGEISFSSNVYLVHELLVEDSQPIFTGSEVVLTTLKYNGVGGTGSYIIKRQASDGAVPWGGYKNLGFDANSLAENSIMVDGGTGIDWGYKFENIYCFGFPTKNHIKHTGFIVNIHMDRVRFDPAGEWCIEIDGGVGQEGRPVTVSRWTWDNNLVGDVKSGHGFLNINEAIGVH